MKKEFKIIAQLIENNTRVLDVGCGDGTLMEYLKLKQHNDVRGLEPQKDLVRKCIAKGLPENGKLVAIDNSDEFLLMAEKYWKMAEVDSKIESIIADGVEAMQSMIDRKHFFDFIFIDADKNNYPHYYELSLQLLSPNGIIIIDNMLWHGDVADDKKQDTQTNTIRELNLKIQKDDRINYSLLPLSDGLSFIQKK